MLGALPDYFYTYVDLCTLIRKSTALCTLYVQLEKHLVINQDSYIVTAAYQSIFYGSSHESSKIFHDAYRTSGR